MAVRLRPLADADLDALFEWEREPGAVEMAAFTRADPSDRAAYDAHNQRVRSDPSNLLYAVDDEVGFGGTVASFTRPMSAATATQRAIPHKYRSPPLDDEYL